MNPSDEPEVSADAGLLWSVKRSLLRYVRRLPDGVVSVAGGTGLTPDLSFHFPLRDADAFDTTSGEGVVRFGGALSLSGHSGMMAVVLDDLILRVRSDDSEAPSITVLDLSILGQNGDRSPFVSGTLSAEVEFDDSLQLTCAEPLLTAEGSELLGDVYPVGSVFDPLVVRVPIQRVGAATPPRR